jgi:hypothetical protein
MEVVFGTQSYESRALQVSAQRLVNCFVEAQPEGTKSQVPLFGAPGLTPFAMLPTSPVRGMWNYNGNLWAVAGDSLYRLNAAKGYKKVGSGISGNDPVVICDNGPQVLVINGISGYIATTATDAFQEIQDPNFNSANTVTFFDDYFVFNRKGTKQFFLSGLLDGLSYNGLDFASAEADTGLLIGVAKNLQLLYLFGESHTEMWYDAGAVNFPFARYAGAVIPRGCIAPGTIIAQDQALFFLANDRIFYRLQGNEPIRMSTHGVEKAIESYGDNITDAFCFTYTQQGHKMVHLTFPSVPHSWVFDISTRKWHERESWDANKNTLNRWRGNCAAECYNKVLIGDFQTGQIWQLDWNAYDEGGNTMQMLAHSSPVHDEKFRLFLDLLELDMQSGVGLTNGQGSAPVVMLRWSKDGGETWSALQPPRSIGKRGAYVTRQRWKNLGQAYQWIFELTISDPVQRALISTYIEGKRGMA